MCTVRSCIFQVFWTVVGTGNFNSFWVCNFNKWKKNGEADSTVSKSFPRSALQWAGKKGMRKGTATRRGLTWFPSLYFQPCWRTPKKVARMRSAEVSPQGPGRLPAAPHRPAPAPFLAGWSIPILWPSPGSAKHCWSKSGGAAPGLPQLFKRHFAFAF